jgi:hypothetical protein
MKLQCGGFVAEFVLANFASSVLEENRRGFCDFWCNLVSATAPCGTQNREQAASRKPLPFPLLRQGAHHHDA